MRYFLQSQPLKRQKTQFFDDFFAIFQKNANFLPKSEMFLQKMVNKTCPPFSPCPNRPNRPNRAKSALKACRMIAYGLAHRSKRDTIPFAR